MIHKIGWQKIVHGIMIKGFLLVQWAEEKEFVVIMGYAQK